MALCRLCRKEAGRRPILVIVVESTNKRPLPLRFCKRCANGLVRSGRKRRASSTATPAASSPATAPAGPRSRPTVDPSTSLPLVPLARPDPDDDDYGLDGAARSRGGSDVGEAF